MRYGYMNNPHNDLKKEIAFCKRAGFDFLDLTLEGKANREEILIKEIKPLLKGMEVVGHTCPSLPIGSTFEEVRRGAVNEFCKTLDVFKSLGVKKVNIHPYPKEMRLNKKKAIENNIRSLKQMVAYAKKNKQVVMLENDPSKGFRSFKEVMQILTEVKGLALHLDIGHAAIAGKTDLKKFIMNKAHPPTHIHFSDNFGEDDDHLFIGCGNIDWKEVIILLKKSGYDGTVTLECFRASLDLPFNSITGNKLVKGFRGVISYLKSLEELS